MKSHGRHVRLLLLFLAIRVMQASDDDGSNTPVPDELPIDDDLDTFYAEDLDDGSDDLPPELPLSPEHQADAIALQPLRHVIEDGSSAVTAAMENIKRDDSEFRPVPQQVCGHRENQKGGQEKHVRWS